MKNQLAGLLFVGFTTMSFAQLSPQPIFKSGFGGITSITQAGNTAIISGVDFDFPGVSDWSGILENNPETGDFDQFIFSYQGGSFADRRAEIVQDPGTFAKNDVLKFEILNSYDVGDSVPQFLGRVQAGFNSNNIFSETLGTGYERFNYSTKVFLPNTWENMADDIDYSNGWFTLMEFFNNGGWIDEDPTGYHAFRISVNLYKEDGIPGLKLRATAETRTGSSWDTLIWDETSSIDIPINQWTEIEIDMKEGDSISGYFKLKVDGVLHINKTDWTHHPADPLPDGFAHLQPLKLYTGKPQIDHFKANYGGNPTVYWDNFTIFNTSSLKVKYLKLIPSDCGVELNHSNNEITAPAIPGVGESWNNWSYVYRFQNVNDNTNVFYKGSYFNTISIDPFACDPLYDDSEYRIRVRVKNHPYFFDFGGSNDNYCLNSTSFVLCSSPGLTITPNPFSSGLLDVHLSEVDSVKSIEIREITGGIVRLFGPNDFHSFQNKISLSNLELDKGLYLVRIDFGNKIETRKIVVR